MKSVTAVELRRMLDEQVDLQMIDVREPGEHQAFNIGGELVPLEEVMRFANQVAKDRPVVFYCRKGVRSQVTIQRLQTKFPLSNLYNLIGGTEAWQRLPPRDEGSSGQTPGEF